MRIAARWRGVVKRISPGCAVNASPFMAIPDEAAISCMRRLFRDGLTIGESGVAGLAGFLLAGSTSSAREMLGLDGASRVLVFGTEGATDPALFGSIVESGIV